MGIEEWMDGTPNYYWLSDPAIGLASWMKPLVMPLLLNPFLVTLINWGTILLELILFAGLFMSQKSRKQLFRFGILFHIAIALFHGLISLGLIMVGALTRYLLPLEEEETKLDWPKKLMKTTA